eukprot:Skav203705  [mRNA]  locus=scaffold259:447065:448015:+ [translate_table: standard]
MRRSWQNMEEAKRRGLCRHIGVSNYPVEFMKEIDEFKTEPIYNEQQELHPLAQFRDVQEYTRKAKISLTGYGTGGVVASTPVAQDIAQKIKRTPGQVLLRWAVQKGIHVTPKSNQVPWRDRQWDNGKKWLKRCNQGTRILYTVSFDSSA